MCFIPEPKKRGRPPRSEERARSEEKEKVRKPAKPRSTSSGQLQKKEAKKRLPQSKTEASQLDDSDFVSSNENDSEPKKVKVDLKIEQQQRQAPPKQKDEDLNMEVLAAAASAPRIPSPVAKKDVWPSAQWDTPSGNKESLSVFQMLMFPLRCSSGCCFCCFPSSSHC